jgi:hypothetical protein
MFILFRPTILTSLFLLLFIGAAKCFVLPGTTIPGGSAKSDYNLSSSNNKLINNNLNTNLTRNIVSNDSLKSEELISFNINPEIQYLSINHFQNDESRQAYIKARQKEVELAKTSTQSDSLRKIYSKGSDAEKETIAQQILNYEEKSIGLNNEIVSLFQIAYDKENHFWQEQTDEKRRNFREMILSYQDSITKSKQLEEYEKAANVKIDTTLFSRESAQKQVTGENPIIAVVYKIQIGAYKGKLPETAAKMIKKLSMLRKVENYIDEKGYSIYTTGNLKTYQEAVTLQNQVKQEGVKNPTVTAYFQGKKIPVEEAKKINKEL